MSNNCNRYSQIEPDLIAQTLSTSERHAWEAHCLTCPVCQEQWAVHQQLNSVAITRSVPSIDFNEKFWAEAAVTEQQMSSSPRLSGIAQIGMWLYWIAAAVASLFILLSRIEWTTSIFTHPWTPYIAAIFTPIGFLLIFSADRIRQRLIHWFIFLFR